MGFFQNTLIKPKPEPTVFVNDYAGLLSHAEIQRLEEKLVHFDKATTHQLAIIILPSLEGNSIEALTNEWFKHISNNKQVFAFELIYCFSIVYNRINAIIHLLDCLKHGEIPTFSKPLSN